MKKISICIFVCAFFLCRPYQLQHSGLCYSGDDQSYFAHATAIVFQQYPHYDKEFFTMGKERPEHPLGPSLLAAPFVYVFSLVDRVLGSDIVIQRTRANISSSWSLFGFVFATIFYFWVSCWLLYKGLRFHFEEKFAFLSIVALVFMQGLPLFAFRRPVFSHVYELFLQSLLIFLLLKYRGGISLNRRKYLKLFLIGIVIALMGLVRYNNIIMAIAWPLVLIGRPWRKNILNLFVVYGVFVLTIFLFKFLPELVLDHSAGMEGASFAKGYLLAVHDPLFYMRRIMHIFFGIDWGLVFTAPFIILGLGSLLYFRFPLRKALVLISLPLLVNFVVVVQWLAQGGWYGYRYLVFSSVPVFAYPLAFLFRALYKKMGNKMYILLFFIAIFPFLSMICFDGNNTNLTLKPLNDGYFGRGGSDNLTYQLEVWKTVLFHPIQFSIAIFKGGVLYLVYLASLIFRVDSKLPAVVLSRYPVFDLSVFIKMVIIYFLPFVLYWVSGRDWVSVLGCVTARFKKTDSSQEVGK
ncbi:MAG: hypothetical protein KAJ18_01100 [Candidatus Omnitrophica bacterium]|nr:hypothetical protein [Candidatus Omnitrophota bacterium]